jgi:hypothetical protein
VSRSGSRRDLARALAAAFSSASVFARLIQRPVRVLGGPLVRAACGGHLSLTKSLLTVMDWVPHSYR